MDEELPEPVLEIDDDLPEPILLEEDSENPGVYKFNPPIKANIKLKIKKDDPVRKCKLNAKKIYKIYEDERQIKSQVDVLVVALREIKDDKSVSFNKNAGLKRIESASATLNLTKDESASLVAQWDWFVVNRKNKNSAEFKDKESKFFGQVMTKRRKLKASKYPNAQVLDWIKHSALPLLEIICEVADTEVTALELWVSAFKEGISKYVITNSFETSPPTKEQLKYLPIDIIVDGFAYLGLDDFYTDYTSNKYPLKNYLPSNFNNNISEVTETDPVNEQGRTLRSADFPNMLMAIQALKANYERRKQFFLDDAKKYGYTTPTKDETIYWIYVYSNVGIYGGKKSLKEYEGKRVLFDWIKKGKYKNSIKVYESYKLAKDLGLFQ